MAYGDGQAGDRGPETVQGVVTAAVIAFGAVSLLKTSRFLSLALLGACLYETASKSDAERRRSGKGLLARRAASRVVDLESDESFPASDPPSYSGSTAGAP